MPSDVNVPLKGIEDAETAFKRVEPDALALKEEQFSPFNVDVIGASATILGVLERLVPFREQMAKLPEFDMVHVDQLEDRAKAAWFAFITNLPEPEPKDFDAMFEECKSLRKSMMTWADPLVFAGQFDKKSVDKIKEGSGNKDIPSDVVAFVVLYRSKWGAIRNMCGVTEAELDRGALIGPIVFATLARRENQITGSQSDGSQRVRRFWTLADRSYAQCQRALDYLEWSRGGSAPILPSLRHNTSTKGASPAAPSPTEPPVNPSSPATPTPTPAGPVVGGGSDPFGRR